MAVGGEGFGDVLVLHDDECVRGLAVRAKGPCVYLAQADGLGSGCRKKPKGQRPGSLS